MLCHREPRKIVNLYLGINNYFMFCFFTEFSYFLPFHPAPPFKQMLFFPYLLSHFLSLMKRNMTLYISFGFVFQVRIGSVDKQEDNLIFPQPKLLSKGLFPIQKKCCRLEK